jgi:DNA ligase-1
LLLVPALRTASSEPVGTPPALSLANVYHEVELHHYWVSEKLDGVRAYWDGERLISRGGSVLNAPAWYTAGFPSVTLDGELWMGRGTFDAVSAAVRRHQPIDAEWQQVRYMVFDLPMLDSTFDDRLVELRRIVTESESPYLKFVEQGRVSTEERLQQRLRAVVSGGGEGLMLHRGSARYRAGRSDDLLKLKLFQDAEARVIAHLPGNGRYQGMLGSLLVELPDGRRFRLGTGFNDAERRDPPPLGTLVTYRYQGLTGSGLPRFASFMRVRD